MIDLRLCLKSACDGLWYSNFERNYFHTQKKEVWLETVVCRAERTNVKRQLWKVKNDIIIIIIMKIHVIARTISCFVAEVVLCNWRQVIEHLHLNQNNISFVWKSSEKIERSNSIFKFVFFLWISTYINWHSFITVLYLF